MARVCRHASLRNANINYRSGWWAVSIQAAKNKSIFGAIVGERVVLNALGRAVEAYWAALPQKYPELELFDFVLMPNHFHALLRIHFTPGNIEHHLGFLMSRFKGGTSFVYGKMRRAGEIENIGEHLWQRDYWDDLITSDAEFKSWQKYIRENPANWSSDRYGACTAYSCGDIELLNRRRIAFVASQGFFASALHPRRVWPAKAGRSDEISGRADKTDRSDEISGRADKAGLSDEISGRADKAGCSDEISGRADKAGLSDELSGQPAKAGRSDELSGQPAKAGRSDEISGRADKTGLSDKTSERAASAALISTFTSAQEREALRRALAKRKPLIAIFPAGLPQDGEWPGDLAAAIREGWALAVSPQPPGSRLNKKIATWCNEFLLKNADEIWVGDLSANGMLRQMLMGLGVLGGGDCT